jgi:hypothetical protein
MKKTNEIKPCKSIEYDDCLKPPYKFKEPNINVTLLSPNEFVVYVNEISKEETGEKNKKRMLLDDDDDSIVTKKIKTAKDGRRKKKSNKKKVKKSLKKSIIKSKKNVRFLIMMRRVK